MKSQRKLLSNGSNEQSSSSPCLMEGVIDKFCSRRRRKHRTARPRRNHYLQIRHRPEQQEETSLLDKYINDCQWEAALNEIKEEETYRIEHAFEAMVVEYCRSSNSTSSQGREDPPTSMCNETALCFYDDDSVQHQRSETDMKNESSSGNENILMKSCRLGAPIQIIERILSLFPDMILSTDTMSGKTPLHFACEGSNASLETIQTLCKQLLIQAPLRILHRDYAGLNALHVALKHGAPQEIVSYLSDICSNLQTCFKWY